MLIEEAGECGYRPLLVMLGSLSGEPVEPQVLSYQGPLGVGYCVAAWEPSAGPAGKSVPEAAAGPAQGDPAHSRILLDLARGAVESYLVHRKLSAVPDQLPEALREPAGAFVCIKIDGELRGCIGTIAPRQDNLAAEVIQNAVSAAFEDPRFPPVGPQELKHLTYSVDVLLPPEPVSGLQELDPRRYGVIVRWKGRTGLLLPDLEGVDTVEAQVDIARRKAGIPAGAPLELSRFLVVRHEKA